MKRIAKRTIYIIVQAVLIAIAAFFSGILIMSPIGILPGQNSVSFDRERQESNQIAKDTTRIDGLEKWQSTITQDVSDLRKEVAGLSATIKVFGGSSLAIIGLLATLGLIRQRSNNESGEYDLRLAALSTEIAKLIEIVKQHP